MNSCWIEKPASLFKNMTFIPKPTMTKNEKINTITRLIIVIFLLIFLVNNKNSFLFLLLSIFFIIIYYLQKSEMSYEHYSPKYNHIIQSEDLYKKGLNEYKKNRYTIEKFPSYYTNERIDSTDIVPDQTFVSKNQKLVGTANSKTLVAPVVVPPSYDWTHWKDNDFVYPSIINEKRTQDFYRSGYLVDEPHTVENYMPALPSTPYYTNQYTEEQQPPNTQNFYDGKYPFSVNNGHDMGSSTVVPKNYKKEVNKRYFDYPGNINKSCTYDQDNIKYNLPSNYMAGNCERSDNVKDLNGEIFTSTITPGVYYKNEVIEPLNYNIGISFDQQIPNRKKTIENGNIMYTALDENVNQMVEEVDTNDYGTAPYEVYDPRTNGYGTSDREYTHELTGQPRFYYDDINAARRPNYVTRTNIDHLLNADSYGIMPNQNDIMKRNCDSRKIAEEGVVDNAITFRTDLMTRLMRKRNSELWQQRVAPLQKGGNFTMSLGNR